MAAGARYSEPLGFHVDADAYLDDVWAWLPLRWKHPQEPQLKPEMLPGSTWEDNLRTALTTQAWDVLRKHCYAAAGHRCEICGEAGRMECHERWSFDDVWTVQKLEGLISLCSRCHKAHHLGIARRLGLLEDVLAKMCEVNGWTRPQLEAAIEEARTLADERSRYHWHVDLSWLETGQYNLLYQLRGR